MRGELDVNVFRTSTMSILLLAGLLTTPLAIAESQSRGGTPDRLGESLREGIVAVHAYRGRELAAFRSGFVVHSRAEVGYVVTNAGPLDGADSITVRSPRTGTDLVARIMHQDERADVAVLKVDGLAVAPMSFSAIEPQIGDVVWSVAQWSETDPRLAIAKGELSSRYPLENTDYQVLNHTALGGSGDTGSILLNDCGQVVGMTLAGQGGAGSMRAIDGASLQELLSTLRVHVNVASGACMSEVMQVRRQAELAAAEAKRATEEAARAQTVARNLERRLQASNERNEALEQQAASARARAEEAIRLADVAQQNAEETRLELERTTASILAETEAFMKYMERDREAAETRFRDALTEQREASALRERIIIAGAIALIVFMGLTVWLIRGRAAPSAVTNAAGEGDGRGALGVRGSTEMHRDQQLVEYVLDGRDEDGIRYLLRISGDQMDQPEGVVIGRNPQDSPYIINHADVSRRHARMKVMKNRVFIEDLGSTNGTSVNGQSIEDKGPVTVNNGDQIIIGSVVMKLRVLGA